MDREPMKMFRGKSKWLVKEHFRISGWPEEAAELMAHWLTYGQGEPPPEFAEVVRLAVNGKLANISQPAPPK